DCLKPRPADAIDGLTWHSDWDTSLDRRLPRHVHTSPGLQHAAHDHVAEIGRIDAGASDRFANDHRAEVRRREILERTAKGTNWRATRADDHCGFVVGHFRIVPRDTTHVVSAFEFGGEIAWRPTPEYIERSRLTAFMRKHDVRDYAQLMQRSTTDLDWFWRAVLDDLGIQFYEPYRAVLDTSRGIAHTQWCVGGRMNIVHNCLDKWMGTPVQHRPALHWEGEEGTSRTMTYEQLRREVYRCANGLRRMGIGRGDRVALFMPMCPELVAAFFAVVTVGGIVLPLFSGYGADAVGSRLQDSGAKALFT